MKDHKSVEIDLDTCLGSGSHAKVYAGEFNLTPVAVKVFDNKVPQNLNAFLNELESHTIPSAQPQIITHPNIVEHIGAFQDLSLGQSYLITDLSEFGTLQ